MKCVRWLEMNCKTYPRRRTKGTDDATQRVLACFKNFADHSLDNTALPGILAVVLRAADRVPLFPTSQTLLLQDLILISSQFDFALGQRDDLKESLMRACPLRPCSELALTLKDAVYIQETQVDVATAHNSSALPGDLGIKKRF